MALHEQAVGATDEWYTPPRVFDAMGTQFDLDVAAPAGGCAWIPARTFYSKGSDGLVNPWFGFVWMNAPFGGRNGLVPWLQKFFDHGDGIALTPDRTSAPWWQAFAPRAEAVLFIAPKLKFIGPDGRPGTSPAQGTTLMAAGARGVQALRRAAGAGLGFLMEPASPTRTPQAASLHAREAICE
jgi:hypothetical protein